MIRAMSSGRAVQVVVPLVALLAAACTAGGPGASRGASPDGSAPSSSPSAHESGAHGFEGADLVGTLSGDPTLEGGCAWIRSDDGEDYEVVYPDGWEVRTDPIELRDPNGEVVAVEGDRIGLMGAEEGTLVSICQIGPIFRATEVMLED